eukprot:scaffold8605_cov178-Amphora_coffeaeformis.AAC.8
MLLTFWSALWTHQQQDNHEHPMRLLDNINNHHVVYDDDDGGDDRFWSRSHLQKYNQTIITSTVTIRVTPREDFMVSWSILAAALWIAIGVAAWQVYKERHVDRQHQNNGNINGGMGTSSSSTSTGIGGVGGSGGGVPDSDRLMESASTAEVTRCVVSTNNVNSLRTSSL